MSSPMLNRREMLMSLGGLVAGAVYGRLDFPMPGFPRKSDFRFAEGWTYINGAYTHPMPIAAADAYKAFLDGRSTVGASYPMPRVKPKDAFAALINAKPTEVGYIPNTSTGENLVIESLGIAKNTGNVVTDGLHFEGALVHLRELEKNGLDLRVVAPRDGRIDLRDLERVVDKNTRLIECSFVSMYNGFQHDLKAVADLAHAHGAYVYADIIQGVGAVPLDIHATGVDFAATATYKWLMGDFGMGFMYVREDLLGSVFHHSHWSYESAPDLDMHLSPLDPNHATPLTYTAGTDLNSYTQLGTLGNGARAALEVSLPYIQSLGVEAIQQHRQPLLQRLQAEMPRLGFTPQTPPDSTSPIVTFAHKDEAGITKKLAAARVNVRVADYWMRISPSIYNDMADVEHLLAALS
jgi:selenocysteine lyase/cysteine desulfurase